MKRLVCGIDLGGTKINTGIVNENGEVLGNIKVDTRASEGPDAVIQRMIKSVEDVLIATGYKASDLSGIGIGSPGPIDSERGIIVESANLPGWNNVPLVDMIYKKFNVSARLENDANVAALGEFLFGSGKGLQNFVYMTVSTGIGGGVVIGGKLYTGTNSNAAEIGHSIIDFNGPKCNCGNYGCYETFASGTAIARFARERIEGGEKTIIKDIAGDINIKAEHVFEAAKAGDSIAKEIIDKEAFYLAIGIVNILLFYNPQRIAIGGGVANQWDMLKDKVIKVVGERAIKSNVEACEIVTAELGGNVGLLGAAGLVL